MAGAGRQGCIDGLTNNAEDRRRVAQFAPLIGARSILIRHRVHRVIRRSPSPAVVWSDVGRETFDRCVEALIFRRHVNDQVHVIDGRGGDGGKDVEVTTPDGSRVVYQLKYFPEGFSGPFKDRRGQVKRSFDAVMTDAPRRWVLVSPDKFTRSEWSYLGRLRQEHPPLEVDAWDQARLDEYLASQTDLVDYMQRDDELLRQASILAQERAVLARPAADLVARLVGLGGVVDGVDPHYTLDFARHGSGVSFGLRAKHAEAQKVQPLAIDIKDAFAPDDPALLRWERAIKFGSREQVTLTAAQLKHVRIAGTSLLDGLEDLGEDLTWIFGEELDPVACTLEAKDANGRRLRLARGAITHVGHGQAGDSLDLDFYGLLTLELRVHRDQTAGQLSMIFSLDLEHAPPRDAESALMLSLSLTTAASVDLRGPQENRILTTGPLGVKEHEVSQEELAVALEIASDLRSIEEYTSADLMMPNRISLVERVLLRILRRAHEGRVSLHPTNNTVTFTLAPDAPEDRVESLLSGQGGAIFFQRPTETVEIGDLRLEVEGLSFYHPNMALRATPAEITEMRRRKAEGEEVTIQLRSQDGTNLRVYMLEKTDSSNTNAVPWGLRSVPESAGLPIPPGAETALN